MSEKVKVDASDFDRSVHKWAERVERQVADALMEAAQETRNHAVRLTPVDTGALRAGWKVRQGPTGHWTEVYNETPYAAAVEFGSKPHVITAKNKKVLANRKTGQVFGQRVNHPGSRPRPMLRPAIAAVTPRLIAKLRRII